MKKAALFDLDGTILDTTKDIGLALSGALGCEFSDEQVMRFIGRGLRNAVRFALAELGRADTPDDQIDEYTEKLNQCYRAVPVKYTKPYPGVTELLTELQSKGIHLGVYSNKNQELVEPILAICFPGINFEFMVGMHGKYEAKPSAQAVNAFCETVGVELSEILYVGDSEVDFKTACNAKVDYRILTSGSRSRQSLLESGVPESYLIDSIEAIRSLF